MVQSSDQIIRTRCGVMVQVRSERSTPHASNVRPSKLELQSAKFQKRRPTGRSAAAATLVHSSTHLTTAGRAPLMTSRLKPSEASYLPRERQKILGDVFAPTTPSGYLSSGFSVSCAMMLSAARCPLISAVWPSLSSRDSCDIMSPTAKMLGWPASCSWSLTMIESRKPKALLKGESWSILVLGNTPTHLYTTPAGSTSPDLSVIEVSPMSAIASPSRSSTPFASSHLSAN
mmetsp:Transcript_41437/g.103017  ORF Transcript_41437/g.103017 Transcript_41437/m.103017 type:complete len:231 (-) Transcript_41437:134-826(-)